MKTLHIIAFILVIIGGLNWLLIGLGDWNVVALLGTTVARIVYILVGLAAIVEVINHKKCCSCCSKASSAPSQMM